MSGTTNRRIRPAGGALLVLLSGVTAATAGEGMHALYEGGDYRAAREAATPRAAAGEASARYLLGTMMLSGQGGPRQVDEGIAQLRRAAEAGHADAALALGNLYASGTGVPLDGERAARWLKLAAELTALEGRDSGCD